MAKGYWINTVRSIKHQKKLDDYIAIAGPAIQDHGGRFLARGLPEQAFESGVIERTVLIEFPSVGDAIAAHESAGYQRALRVLDDGADRDIRIIEGIG